MAFAESTTAEQSSQPYKYNGKELDETHGLNWYDYSARFYDAGYITLPTIDPIVKTIIVGHHMYMWEIIQ